MKHFTHTHSYENTILCENMRITNNDHQIKIKNNKRLRLKYFKFQIKILVNDNHDDDVILNFSLKFEIF